MAELVDRNMEDMLPEIEALTKSNLFDGNEVRDIIKRRSQFETKLAKRNKRLLDFQAYIHHEMSLMGVIKIRRQRHGHSQKELIEKSLVSRLVRLHRQMCYRFQEKVDLWLAFIRLSDQLGRGVSTRRIWERFLQVHPQTSPKIWTTAAHWELHRHVNALAQRRVSKIRKRQKSLAKTKSMFKSLAKKKRAEDKDKGDAQLAEDLAEVSVAETALSNEESEVHDRAVMTGMKEASRRLWQGLRQFPKDQGLYLELAKLEMLRADFIRHTERDGKEPLDPEMDTEKIGAGEGARLVVLKALDIWPNDTSFVGELSQVVDKFPSLADTDLAALLTARNNELSQQKKTQQPEPKSKNPVLSDLVAFNTLVMEKGRRVGQEMWRKWKTRGGLSYAHLQAYLRLEMSGLSLGDPSDPAEVKKLVKELRAAFEVEADNWGRDSVDFWLDYISLETSYGDSLNVSTLYHRAEKTLNEHLVPVFRFNFNYGK